MVPALHDDERVARKVLARDEPWGCHAVLQSADTQTTALPERIARKALMLADDQAVGRLDRTRLARQPGLQELAEGTLTDEADAGGVALVEYRQAALAGDRAHFPLAERAYGEVAAGKFRAGKHVQEVALVFLGIDAAQQAPTAADARVMAGRESLRAQAPRIGQAEAELDLAVAEHVGIRGSARAQLSQEMRKDALPILRGETDAMQRDAELRTTVARVLEIGGGRAIAVTVVLPVRHEQALDVVAGILQQRCRDRGIDAARHRDDVAGHGRQMPAAGGDAGRT